MWQARGELAQLEASTVEGDTLEGRIWAPSIATTPVQVGAWERLERLQSGPEVRLAVTEARTTPRLKGDGLCVAAALMFGNGIYRVTTRYINPDSFVKHEPEATRLSLT